MSIQAVSESRPDASEDALEDAISGATLRLRARAPFFATLCLFARFIRDEHIPTACTDGKDVYYNPDYLASLSPVQLETTILHEVLHAALMHVIRCGTREGVRWNVAADIVVNGILAADSDLELAPGSIREPSLEHLPVEEIYELISAPPKPQCPNCLRPGPGGPGRARRIHDIEAYWRDALHKARTLAESKSQGSLPGNLLRHIERVSAPQIDWRAALWRFVVRTPVDFIGYDRRFLHAGLYLDALDGETVRVFVAVDTSGSISERLLAVFMAEVHGILRTYPHIEMTLYYADAAVHGPYVLGSGDVPPAPKGGGGTSFAPFFKEVEEQRQGLEQLACVYLTDGYGTFPEAPGVPVLWVVRPGGLESERFPFGQVIRLRE